MSTTYPGQLAVAICANQNTAIALYKARIKELEARVEELEADLEAESKRLQQTKARNSKLSRENAILRHQAKGLSADLVEAYDAVDILNKKVMDHERHVRRDS